MALCHFPTIPSTSLKPCSFSPSIRIQGHVKWKSRHFPPCNLVCFAKKSSGSKKRAAKTSKSNEDLRNELREFISAAGLPGNHVPTMKELSEHGRKDLANIVRRKGYKVITELLMNPPHGDTRTERSTTETPDSSNGCDEEPPGVSLLGGFLPGGSCMAENYISSVNGTVPTVSCVPIRIHEPLEPSSRPMQEKARKFVQTGEIDTFEDLCEIEDLHMLNDSMLMCGIQNSDSVDPVSHEGTSLSIDPFPQRDEVTSDEGLKSVEYDDKLGSEANEIYDQNEIDHLKEMLHQKEMELSLLKQQIEKEKVALSILENKASSEIGNARSIISAKNAELLVAEENLSGLKEVKIEYWGSGDVVEVAGSFNGWHHWIKMDLDPSYNALNTARTRESILWSTTLWLYPGIYEIKFIVDGHWRIDSQRETATGGNITNNILRVER